MFTATWASAMALPHYQTHGVLDNMSQVRALHLCKNVDIIFCAGNVYFSGCVQHTAPLNASHAVCPSPHPSV